MLGSNVSPKLAAHPSVILQPVHLWNDHTLEVRIIVLNVGEEDRAVWLDLFEGFFYRCDGRTIVSGCDGNHCYVGEGERCHTLYLRNQIRQPHNEHSLTLIFMINTCELPMQHPISRHELTLLILHSVRHRHLKKLTDRQKHSWDLGQHRIVALARSHSDDGALCGAKTLSTGVWDNDTIDVIRGCIWLDYYTVFKWD